jgi:hypothetical protein
VFVLHGPVSIFRHDDSAQQGNLGPQPILHSVYSMLASVHQANIATHLEFRRPEPTATTQLFGSDSKYNVLRKAVTANFDRDC